MVSTDLYALSRSALNPFLYADIGPQDGAATLTIASLFGRRGDDPWVEAARLARMPAAAAAASLAAAIVAMPANPCSLPEATAMAERLVALLPRASLSGPAAGVRRPPPSWLPARWMPAGWKLNALATCALGLGLLVAVVFLWMAVSDAMGPRGSEDRTRMVDPFTHEAPR
jgi:hypothetical protein